MGPRPLFVALGIPVSFDPFFFLGAFLIYSVSGGGRQGIITVIALIIFVVIHEFGHALTAKAFGGNPTITVTFLGGFTLTATTRALKDWESNLISAMGPFTEFAAAIPVIIVAQQLATSSDVDTRALGFEIYSAVAWAGILLACVNLLPLWPLDGGHIVRRATERVVGDGGSRVFLVWSIAASAVLMVASLTIGSSSWVGEAYARMDAGVFASPVAGVWSIIQAVPAFTIDLFFIPLFAMLGSYSELRSRRARELRPTIVNAPTGKELRHTDAVIAARAAERNSWTTGRIESFPRGWSPSPWVLAHRALLAGDRDAAVHELGALAVEHRTWLLDRPDRAEVGHLLGFVPPAAADSLAVLEVRVHQGSAEGLVAAATQRFLDEQSAEPLYLGAAGLAARGHEDEAMQWLTRAVAVAPDPQRMAIDREFHRLHRRSDFQQLLGVAERTSPSGART